MYHAGETGPMVSTTLKLGISILNGGNSEVQRVSIPGFPLFSL